MHECNACKKPIVAQPIVVVQDGTLSADGELEIQNTEFYHPSHVTIDW